MRRLSVIILMLFALTLPSVAGVVEDAEEELKKLKKQQQVQRSSGSRETGSPPSVTENSYPTSGSQTGRSKAKSQNRTRKSRSATTTKPTSTGLVELEEPRTKTRERSRTRARERDKSDRLLSVLGLAVLVVLIVLGAWFGSRGDGEA